MAQQRQKRAGNDRLPSVENAPVPLMRSLESKNIATALQHLMRWSIMNKCQPHVDGQNMRFQDRTVPTEQLISAIEEILKTGPHSIDEIARELGYSVAAIRSRLDFLQLENRVHRRKVEDKRWLGVGFLWHYGAAADVPLVALEPHGDFPIQSTVRTYPAIDRRDPLVAALFGSGHRRQRGLS
jgi:hypothetical protein